MNELEKALPDNGSVSPQPAIQAESSSTENDVQLCEPAMCNAMANDQA